MTANTHIPQGAASDDQQVKRSLILPGGGLRLSYVAGVLEVLFEHGLSFQHMDGTSGGSLNLAMLLSGLDAKNISERWRTLNMRDTIAFMPLHQCLSLKNFTAAASADGFRKKVYPHLGIDFERIRAAQGIEATFNLCHFASKTNVVIPHQQMTEDYLVAGMSLPGALPPVDIDGEIYLDSGFIQDANLMEAVKRGANEIWLVWIMGNISQYRSGVLDLYVQMLEMSANGALHKEFEQIQQINQRIEAGETVYGHQQPIRLHLIKPAHPLPLDSALYTGDISHAQLIELGKEDAQTYLNSMTKEGVPFEPQVTTMTTKTLGIQFKETMAGYFTLDETVPKKGAESGKQQRTKLAMHAQVDIDDIDQFVKTGAHPGGLGGTIDFEPLGKGMPAHSGVFNLFFPAEEPETKFMVYELGFNHQGQEYYLAGKKVVRDDLAFDLWSDTTTLYTTLHKGTDKEAEVIGAGILTLGVKDLVKLVSTITVLNADSTADKVKTVGKFGRFFMGELWETYGIRW
ncbi:patatin-like phospholipase family protein [Alteromonadaceae bacterium BrNp21-10]|nr:patatin-like phospholipase family protein [Alteromonadaceae bacterium BrNp21-10]